MNSLRPVATVGGAAALACLVAAGITATTVRAPRADLSAAAAPASAQATAAQLTASPLGFKPNNSPAALALTPSAPDRAPAISLNGEQRYYAELAQQLRWVDVRFGASRLRTPDPTSRLLLVKSAAERARLGEVGLNWADVYGIINAETSWVPRGGASKDGTPNHGIAQFEPATAKALGLENPDDPVESVHVMAEHLRDAAVWSAKRLATLKLAPNEYAAKLREGISIYYNLSTKGRNQWNGRNTAKLPRETQLHISNARNGARKAIELQEQLRGVAQMTNRPALEMVATNAADSGS